MQAAIEKHECISEYRLTEDITLSKNHWAPWTWAILLLLINLPLFWGEVQTGLLFFPEAVLDGQWWRIATYSLVHLSWYHLLLDGGAFLLLFPFLEEKRLWAKTIYLITTCAGTLLLVLAIDPAISQRGLSGLSGIAHGLMAISALEMMRHRDQRLWGLACLFAVVAKSGYELISGQVMFEFMHMGLCGQPLAACHAGGVIGGLLAFGLIHLCPNGHCKSNVRQADHKRETTPCESSGHTP